MGSAVKPRASIDQRLRESELQLKVALKAAWIGVWDWNLQTSEMTYSARARAIFGFPPGKPVTFEMVRGATHPDDLPHTAAQAQRAINPEIRDKNPYEYRIIRADTGEERWVSAHGEAIFSRANGVMKPVRYLGTIVDITERKATETALSDSEMRQRLAIGAAQMAVWELDLATEQVKGSPALNRIYGLPEDATPDIAEFRSRYAPGQRERVNQAGSEALQRGERQFEVEFLAVCGDGEQRWLLLRAEVLFSPAGAPSKVIGVLMDIDDRKRNADRQTLLVRELNHRVKNSLTVVQALAHQTFRSPSATAELAVFQSRLRALSGANNVLLQQDWQAFGLRQLVEDIVAPYREADADPFVVEGEEVMLAATVNIATALALHELCTNSAKYGALSTQSGRVAIGWTLEGGGMRLNWREHGGPAVQEPARSGFGLRLLRQALARELGDLRVDFAPGGLECTMLLPLAPSGLGSAGRLSPGAAARDDVGVAEP